MNTPTRKTHRLPALGAALALLFASALSVLVGSGPALADGQVRAGNQNCAELIAGALEVRVNAPADGTFGNGDGFTVTVDVRTLGSDDPNHAGNQTGSQVFDFTTSGGVVTGVAVKGGPDTNFYDYQPSGVTSGDGLHAPINTSNKKFYGLSHISFCYLPRATPTIVTQVSDATVTIGDSFHDTATLSGGNAPTGTIDFALYGPDDADCSGAAIFTDSVAVNGNGDYDSASFTPTIVGKYRWIASYSGDAGNTAVSGACNDANEDTTVDKVQTTMGLTNWLTPQARANVNLTVDPETGKVGDGDNTASDLTDDVTIVLYLGGGCVAGEEIHTEGFQVDPDGATTQAFTTNNTTLVEITANVSWSWKAFYEGDAVSTALETPCQNVSAAFSEF